MVSVRVPGIADEDAAIESFGLHQIAGVVVGDGLLKGIIDGELINYKNSRATLTMKLVQKIGQTSLRILFKAPPRDRHYRRQTACHARPSRQYRRRSGY